MAGGAARNAVGARAARPSALRAEQCSTVSDIRVEKSDGRDEKTVETLENTLPQRKEPRRWPRLGAALGVVALAVSGFNRLDAMPSHP